MSKMLTLIDAGWASVRTTARRGAAAESLRRLMFLLGRKDLPTEVAADAHRLAGELLIEAERYAEARRHLQAAVVLEPAHARTLYLWGLAFERDPQGCDRRAAVRFRKANAVEPTNPLYRAAFGRAAVRAGREKTGVRELLAAANAAPGNLPVIRIVTQGLLEAGRRRAADRVLTAARFLCRDAVAARELAGLAGQVRFATVRNEQLGATRQRQDAEFARDGGRVVLPLIRVSRGRSSGAAVRRDVISVSKPHFPRLMIRKTGR